LTREGGIHFTSETGFSGFEEVGSVVFGKLKGIGDGIEGGDSEFARLIEAVCNSNGVNATIY
jgi:hypothetical protein